MGFSASRLRAVGVDVKAVAKQRGADQPVHPLLPPQILDMTRHWMKLGGKVTPRWGQFQLLDVAELAPYVTIVECLPDNAFSFAFMGSAVSAILGEDLSGRTFNVASHILAEIDWYRRCQPVAETADLQVLSGSTNPPYTSALEFIAADFPFMTESGGAVSHVVGITVPRLN